MYENHENIISTAQKNKVSRVRWLQTRRSLLSSFSFFSIIQWCQKHRHDVKQHSHDIEWNGLMTWNVIAVSNKCRQASDVTALSNKSRPLISDRSRRSTRWTGKMGGYGKPNLMTSLRLDAPCEPLQKDRDAREERNRQTNTLTETQTQRQSDRHADRQSKGATRAPHKRLHLLALQAMTINEWHRHNDVMQGPNGR